MRNRNPAWIPDATRNLWHVRWEIFRNGVWFLPDKTAWCTQMVDRMTWQKRQPPPSVPLCDACRAKYAEYLLTEGLTDG